MARTEIGAVSMVTKPLGCAAFILVPRFLCSAVLIGCKRGNVYDRLSPFSMSRKGFANLFRQIWLLRQVG